MNALKNYILESLDDKQVNKLFRQFINNYDNEIGDVLKKAGFYSIVTRGVIAAPDRTMYSAKLWKGMLYDIPQKLQNREVIQEGYGVVAQCNILTILEDGEKNE